MPIRYRFHVYARIVIFVCLINDALSIVDEQQWPTTNFSSSKNRPTKIDESSTTIERRFDKNLPIPIVTETTNVKTTDDSTTIVNDLDGRSSVERHDDREIAKIDNTMDNSEKSLREFPSDLENVIDDYVDSKPRDDVNDDFFTTESSDESEICVIAKIPSTFMNVDDDENYATTTIDETPIIEVVVDDLRIIEPTTKSLTIAWKRPSSAEKNQLYQVKWYRKDVPIGKCRISRDFPHHAVIIDSLMPCANYHVTVQPIFGSANVSLASVNGTTKLNVDENSVQLRIADTGSDWIALSWTLPCTDCVSVYKINVINGNVSNEARVNITTYNATGLTPGISYVLELTVHGYDQVYGSVNVTGKTIVPKPEIKDCKIPEQTWSSSHLEGSSPVLFKHYEIPPSSRAEGDIIVEGLRVRNATPDALLVTWQPPNDTLEVSHYVIEWYQTDVPDITACKLSNDTFEYLIDSLTPCTAYTVRVTPHVESANGSKRVVSGTTILNVNKDKLNLKIAETNVDSLQISWNMPSTDCLSHYIVTFCDVDNCTDHLMNKTTYYTKKDLNPCTLYKFNLTVYGNQESAYGSLIVNGTTAFMKPGKPSPATTSPGNNSLLVSWPKPIGHTCVTHYRVVWSRGGKSHDDYTANNSLLLESLEPCASYEIDITAVGINNTDGIQERIQSAITYPAVMNAPTMGQLTSVSDKEISIDWRIRANETMNCVPAKLIVDCRCNKTLGFGYTSVNGTSEYEIPKKTMNEILVTSVKQISPFTEYYCHSYVVNLGGRSENSSAVWVDTLEAVPSAPILSTETSTNVTNTTIPLRWTKPDYLPGILRNITIQIIWRYGWPHRPEGCPESVGTENITNINGNATSYLYSAMPYSAYRIKIAAATGAGWGPASDIRNFQTKPGAPGKVVDLRHVLQPNFEDDDSLTSNVTWNIPCLFNGKDIEYFHVHGDGQRNGFEPHVFTKIVNYTTKNCHNDSCSSLIDELREEHVYSIQVAAKVVDYEDLGERSEIIVVYPAGIPPQPHENYTNIISIDPYKARRTTTTATVLLPIFSDKRGEIKCYAIIVSKIGYNNATFGRLGPNGWPAVATWKESFDRDFQIPYEATKFCLDSLHSHIVDYGRFKAVKFVLGEDTEACPEISSNKDERSYCNGPLKPDTIYHVRMRAFTAGGYGDSTVFTVKTNAELKLVLVICTIFGILLIGILLTMMLLVRRCSLQAVIQRFLHSDMPGSPVPAPFTRRKFVAHCQQLADNPGKLSNEFQLLQTLSVDLQMPTNAACLQANKKKNRYTDILPYDFSRVKLEIVDNDPNTDYINASFIKGFTGDEDYVACQGPKEETTYDFWRMIDQYDVKLIVMLTQLVEKNKEKCHQYFPTIRETFTYENMAIRCSMELDYRTYTQRTLILQKENAKRTIIHLHFKDWPDHDVPEDFDPTINFCQIMRRHMEASRGLVVIHCSAGIGRTGTLIAIDILLQHIKDNRKLDVFGTVYRLRHHRINMVQRESQYAYIYNCIRQVLKNPYFSKTYKPPSVDPICDNSHRKKETSQSTTDLVSSLETLKKSSFSTSVESSEPIYQTPAKSSPYSRTFSTFKGLRCSKSTGAIDTRPCQWTFDRCNTHEHPLSAIVVDVCMNSDGISLETTDSEGSMSSLYENMQPLLPSKSANTFDPDDDSSPTQKLLEHDTAL